MAYNSSQFSNANGVTFGTVSGLSGNVITASVNGGGGGGGVALSAGTNSTATGTVVFSNSNGITFGMNTNAVVTASYNSTQFQTTGNYLTTAMASNRGTDFMGTNTALTANGVSMTANSSGLSLNFPAFLTTAMHSNAATISNVNLSAGTTSNNLSAFVFSNSNGVSFGLNGSTVTATVQTNYLTTAALSQDSSKYAGTGVTTGGGTGMSATLNTNGLSFSIPSWLTTAMQSNAATISNINISGGTTSSNLSAFKLVDSNGVSWSVDTGSKVYATVKTDYQTSGAYLTTADLSQNSSKYVQEWALTGNTAGTTSSAQGTRMYFSGGNNLTVSGSSNSLVFSVGNYITTARGSTDAIGLNTAQSNVTWTVNSSGLSLDARGYAGTATGFSGTNVSATITHNSVGLSLQLSAGGGGVTPAISGTNGSFSFSTVTFGSSNSINFYSTNGSFVASYADPDGVSIVGNTGGTNTFLNTNGTLFLSGGDGVTLSGSAGTIGININTTPDKISLVGNTLGTNSWSVTGDQFNFSGGNNITLSGNAGTIVISAASQSNQTVGFYATGNTTQNSSTTFDARTAGTFNALGAMTMGFSNGSIQVSAPATSSMVGVGAITISTNGSTISISGGTVAASPVNFSAGTTSGNLGSVVFSNSNNITFGLSGSTITMSSPVSFSAGTTSGNLTQVSFANSNGVSFGLNAGTITASAGVMASWYANIDEWAGMVTGASAITQSSGSSMFIQPYQLPFSISAGYFRFLASFNDSAVGTAGTPAANASFSVERYSTFGLVIYSQGTGASSRSIQSIASTSNGLTGRTVFTAGAQSSQYTISVLKTFPNSGAAAGNYNTSYAVSSGSIVISSNSNTLFTGPRFLDISFATSFAPGNYWLGIGHSTSSATNSANISFAGTAAMPISLAAISQSNVSVGVLGAATSASDQQIFKGLGVWTTNALIFSKDSIGVNSISQVVSNPALPFQIIREA